MEKYKKSYKSNKLGSKVLLASMWNGNFELNDESDSVSNIQDSFKYVIKNYEIVGDDLCIGTYFSQIKNMILIRIKTEDWTLILNLDLDLKPETTKLLGSTKSEITVYKNGEMFLV